MRDESLSLHVAVIHETLCGKYIIVCKVRVLTFQMQSFEKVLELVNAQVRLKKSDEAERVEIWGLFPRPPEGESRFQNRFTIPIYIRAQDVDIKIVGLLDSNKKLFLLDLDEKRKQAYINNIYRPTSYDFEILERIEEKKKLIKKPKCIKKVRGTELFATKKNKEDFQITKLNLQ